MPETPKTRAKPVKDQAEAETWEEDQKRRQYYYDDAYGYQTFKDDEPEDEVSDGIDIVTQEPGGNK